MPKKSRICDEEAVISLKKLKASCYKLQHRQQKLTQNGNIDQVYLLGYAYSLKIVA